MSENFEHAVHLEVARSTASSKMDGMTASRHLLRNVEGRGATKDSTLSLPLPIDSRTAQFRCIVVRYISGMRQLRLLGSKIRQNKRTHVQRSC